MDVLSRLFNVFMVLLVFGALGGCAALPADGAAKSPEARLQERAEAYWEARRVSDTQTWYEIESAGRPGGWMTPLVAARMGRDIRFEEVSVGKIAVDGDQATVEVTAVVRYLAMTQTGHPFRQVVVDKWVLIDGEWYHHTPEWKPISTLMQESRERREKGGAAAEGPAVQGEEAPAGSLE